MSTESTQERASYLSHFYQPEVTAYEFMKYFFAYASELTNRIQRDLVDFLYQQKQLPENTELMREIHFRNNGVAYYSGNIDDALSNLQNGGLLGKENPSFGTLILKYSPEEVRKIKESIPDKYKETIQNLATEYYTNMQDMGGALC